MSFGKMLTFSSRLTAVAVAVAAPGHCSVDTELVDGNGGLQQHFRRARVRGTVHEKICHLLHFFKHSI